MARDCQAASATPASPTLIVQRRAIATIGALPRWLIITDSSDLQLRPPAWLAPPEYFNYLLCNQHLVVHRAVWGTRNVAISSRCQLISRVQTAACTIPIGCACRPPDYSTIVWRGRPCSSPCLLQQWFQAVIVPQEFETAGPGPVLTACQGLAFAGFRSDLSTAVPC